MATFTASQVFPIGGNLIERHAGMCYAAATFTATNVTGTASSVVMLFRVPLGATIVDGYYSATSGDTGGGTIKLGLMYPISDTWTVTESVLVADNSTTGGIATTRFLTTKMPARVSLTNNWIGNRNYAWVIAVNSAQWSATFSILVGVMYTMDGSSGKA